MFFFSDFIYRGKIIPLMPNVWSEKKEYCVKNISKKFTFFQKMFALKKKAVSL